MGNHLVKNENSNLMNSISTSNITPANELTKAFINAMYNQTDIDSNGKPFRLNVRRSCCMGAVKVGNLPQSLTENAISIKMPFVDTSEKKCPLNFKKEGDNYVFGDLSLTQENYDKLKLEDCLSYRNIAVLFDLTKEQCKTADKINDPTDDRDFYFEKAKAGLTNENQSCQNWMKWHCSKSIYNQGCMSIKLDSKGNKVRAFNINHYGCGDYNERTKEFTNNVNPQFKECVCINDMNGYTFNNDPGIIRGLNGVYGIQTNEKDDRNTQSIYSLNLRYPKKAPADEVNPIESSEYCNSVMYEQDFQNGKFQAFLNGKERVTQPQVKCINRIDIGTITAGNNANLSGLSQVNNCGNPSQEKKIEEEEKKLLEEVSLPPPASPEKQEKIDKEAEKAQRTNDAKENSAIAVGKDIVKEEEKQKEEDKQRIIEEKARIEKEESELLEKAEELKKAKGQVDDLAEKKDVNSDSTESKSLINEILEGDQKLLMYGGGIIGVLIMILILIIILRR